MLEDAQVQRNSPELEQIISDTLAIRAASDEQVDALVKHELEAFAHFFPANPRQIKRIINAITIYHAVAIQRPDIQPDRQFRARLAAWIIIMTEWPQSWRLLASFPDLVTVLSAEDPEQALAQPGLVLPGSARGTEELLEPIRTDLELMTLITGKGLDGVDHALTAADVRKLAQLTPLHSRIRRMAEPPGPAAAPNAPPLV